MKNKKVVLQQPYVHTATIVDKPKPADWENKLYDVVRSQCGFIETNDSDYAVIVSFLRRTFAEQERATRAKILDKIEKYVLEHIDYSLRFGHKDKTINGGHLLKFIKELKYK